MGGESHLRVFFGRNLEDRRDRLDEVAEEATDVVRDLVTGARREGDT